MLFVYPEPVKARVEVLEAEKEYFPGLSLAPGGYQVRVSKFGYEPFQKSISLEPGQSLDLFVELERMQFWVDPKTGMEFAWVPGGCFQMGCGEWAAGCDPDEFPVHRVCVRGFWMARHEVTQGVWQQVMGTNPSRFQKGENYPVEQVPWAQAKEFTAALQIEDDGVIPRLPTEAEWEYAARGRGREVLYAGERDLSDLGWYQANSHNATHQVGTKEPNSLGLFDMSGNVWEWCQDSYLEDGYSKSAADNPLCKVRSSFRVRRGGSWDSAKHRVRTLYRGRYPPELQFESNGLRVVLAVDQVQDAK